MKKRTALIIAYLLLTGYVSIAQQKNMVKLSVGDCVNCVSSLNYILGKDSMLTFLVRSEYAPDSLSVLEKFDLEAYRAHFIWSNKLYDSLSHEPESELIQFCNGTELNRCGLRRLRYINLENCRPEEGQPALPVKISK